MLAFKPADGFRPSKSGKSWYRLLPTRDAAIACKDYLVKAGIRYACKKVLKARSRAFGGNPRNSGKPISARQQTQGGRRTYDQYYDA